MKTFISQPYQLADSKKWVPHGTTSESIGASQSLNMTEVEMRENEFETENDANTFFINHYVSLGFTEVKRV